MQLSLSFRNAALVRMGLQNLDAEIPKVARRPIYNTSLAIVRREKEYPSRFSSTGYKRTYRFRNNWTITAYELGYKIGNRTSYGHYVVGDAFGAGQAWMHKGIWVPFRQVSEEEIAKLPEAVQNELSLAIRKSGLA